MSKLMITLNQIRDHEPCGEAWKTLLRAKSGFPYDTPFPVSDILESNGLEDTVWTFCCFPNHEKLWRYYTLWCAQQVAPLIDDARVQNCLDQAEKFLEHKIDHNQMRDALAHAEELRVVLDLSSVSEEVAAACSAACCAAYVEDAAGVANEALVTIEAAVIAFREKSKETGRGARKSIYPMHEKLHNILDAGEWV